MRSALLSAALALLVVTVPAAGYETAPVATSGTLRGVVRFAGKPPRFAPVDIAKDRHVCGEQRDPDVLVLGADRGVRDAVILIEGITRGRKPATGELMLDIRDCQFVPRVLAMMIGQRLHVRNGDPVVHNPQGQIGRAPVFNVALPGRGQVVEVTRHFVQPGVVRLRCGVHAETSGWIVVHDSPYFAVTDDTGAFEIDGIPPGTYRVTAWHEPFRAKGVGEHGGDVRDAGKRLTTKIAVVADTTATVEFALR